MKTKTEKKNEVLELSIEFAVEVVKMADRLIKNRHFVIGNQLIRSGTSIGANIHEAQSPHSMADFYHKMKISAKEANETLYWFEVIKHSDVFEEDVSELRNKLYSIIRLLSKILATTKANIKNEK